MAFLRGGVVVRENGIGRRHEGGAVIPGRVAISGTYGGSAGAGCS